MIMQVFMRDVGDGLNLYIDNSMMVDFGGNKFVNCCRCEYFHKEIDTFVLSHFHLDHYNGLFLDKRLLSYYFKGLQNVYYPGIPKIVDDEEDKELQYIFYTYLLAMNHYLLGDKTGVPAADLINILEKISGAKRGTLFKGAFALYKGSEFPYNSKTYKVLWPPEEITSKDESNKRIIKDIKEAIKNFEEAVKDDKELEELVDKYYKNKILDKYLPKEKTEKQDSYSNNEMRMAEYESSELDFKGLKKFDELPDLVKEANKSLCKAANHLSLAFASENKELLFFGDLETNEINKLCGGKELKDKFQIFVTPHHGTHKGKNLKLINSTIAISSVGCKLYNKYLENNEYLKNVSGNLYNTYNDGCISIYLRDYSKITDNIKIEKCKLEDCLLLCIG